MDVDHRNRGCFLDSLDGPPPPSQADEQIQMILQKQLKTKITLTSQFEQHRDFRDAGELCSLPDSSGGLHSVRQLQTMERQVQTLTRLGRAGLNPKEIQIYLAADQSNKNKHKDVPKNQLVEPDALQKRLQELRCRVTTNENQTDGTEHSPSERSCSLPEDPFSYIARIAKKIDASRKRKRQKKRAEADGNAEPDESKPTIPEESAVDPSQWHAVVPLTQEEISSNRLSLEEIRCIPRFADYCEGEPHSVLYLKNLHGKVHLEELIAVFCRYDRAEEPVRYRLMTGRMKGQAFVHFSDVEMAKEALRLSNGYKLRGQPMIVSFARCREPK